MRILQLALVPAWAVFAVLWTACLPLSACGQQWVVTSTPERLKVEVIESFPHDKAAFTQGLLLHEGKFYESTGLYGQSSLRCVDPATGVVERKVDVPAQYFAEGLSLVGNRLYQITWREQTTLVYDLATFEQVDQFSYTGEGWGLCYDGVHLIMSDGSNVLTFRDPATFEKVSDVQVTLGGAPVTRLNELEYVDGCVYANIWQKQEIVKIDPVTGRVLAVIDASGLLTAEEKPGTDVLNGIAWDGANQRFLITGKLWPKVFAVRFVPVQ